MLELKRFVATHQELVTFYASLGMTNYPFLKSEEEAIEQLDSQLKNLDKYPEPFIKMDAMRLQNIQSALEARVTGNKAFVRDIAAALKGDDGLEKSGRIVALDMFNDNTDRFYPGYNTNRKIGPFDILCEACVNPGNVMLAVQADGSLSSTAVDFIDPQSKLKTYGSGVAARCPDGIRAISAAASRKGFCKDIIHDLECFLHPKKSKYSLKTKLAKSLTGRLEAGILQGSGEIKRFLRASIPGVFLDR